MQQNKDEQQTSQRSFKGQAVITGTAANDNLAGTAGADQISGLDGDDFIEGLGGADVIDGGNGIDTVSYRSSALGVTVNLKQCATGCVGTGDEAGDLFKNIEIVEGSNFDDVITFGYSEFQVNTYTNNHQSGPAVASLNGGGFIVVWQSVGQDSDLTGVYCQRYYESNIPFGLEFRANTYTILDQGQPAVSGLSDGGFVVTWHSNFQDGSGFGIYAQRYDQFNVPVNLEFQVNTYTISEQWVSSITDLSSGGFIIVWQSEMQDADASPGVYGQLYNAVGIGVGGEFRVNTYIIAGQGWPKVASLNNGFIVVWHSDGQDGSGLGIYAQRYDVLGGAIGSEFRVNTYTANDQLMPSVITLINGVFVIAWYSNAQDGSGSGIYGQKYDSMGVALGSEFRVNTYTANDQARPSVISFINGGFVIVWHSNVQDGSGWGIFGQKYDSMGVALGSEFRINTYIANDQLWSAAAYLTNGGFVVTWQSDSQDGSGYGVYAQVYSPTTTLLGLAGNDILIGGVQDDILDGGSDNDTLTGGRGSDIFRVSPASAVRTVTITDFEQGFDKIDLMSLYTCFERLLITTFATYTNINVLARDTIILLQSFTGTLIATDFIIDTCTSTQSATFSTITSSFSLTTSDTQSVTSQSSTATFTPTPTACYPGTYRHETTCLLCPPGTYNPYDEQPKCKPCPKGSYNSDWGQIDCMSAPRGSYTNAFTGATNFTYCSAGTYQNNVGFGNSSFDTAACHPCPPKTYNAEQGQVECVMVQLGWYTNNHTGATEKAPCPMNYFNPDVGFGSSYKESTACYPCPDGYYTDAVASKNCTQDASSSISFDQAALENKIDTLNIFSIAAIALASSVLAVAATAGMVSCMSSCCPDFGTWLIDHTLGWLQGKAEDLGMRAVRDGLHRIIGRLRHDAHEGNEGDIPNLIPPDQAHHHTFVFVDNSMAALTPHPIVHRVMPQPLIVEVPQAPIFPLVSPEPALSNLLVTGRDDCGVLERIET